ncbi:MAG: 50S ribosomal protein L17 [Actinomycetaceae bacterium]|nr:50S ribosomal protein L17 [Actinomycetaceae bacterium]
MPKPTKGPRLGGGPAHERLMLANLAQDLFQHGQITTTVAKARRVQPLAEKLITKARRGDIHARRTVAKTIPNKDILYILFDEIAPSIDPEREGGYTRITKIGNRKGDNAPMATISLVTEKLEKKAVVAEADKTAAMAAAAEDEDVAESASSASAESASSASAESADSAQEPVVEEEASEEASTEEDK